MSNIDSPDVIVEKTVPVEVVADPDIQQSESTESATEASETTEEGTVAQSDSTSSDETSKDEDTKTADDKKWIGRRLERAKAQEREKANAEIAALREEIARIKPAVSTQPQVQHNVSTPKPTLSQFNDIEAYTEALTDWKLDQKLAETNARTQEQKVVQDYQSRAHEFAKKATDFETVVNEFQRDYSNVNVPELKTICFESEVGPEIVYHLATHEADMERILELPSHRRLIELGKIEDKLRNSSTIPMKRSSAAPAPIKPEKGGQVAKKTYLDIAKDPNASQADYRLARLKGKRRM